MRIAYVCADRGIPVDGHKGASIHVRAIANALGQRGHDVQVLAVRGGEQGLDAVSNVRRVSSDRVAKGIKQAMRARREAVLASEVNGLLANTMMFDTLEREHERLAFEAIYERYSLWSAAGLQFARRHGLPFILEVNAPLTREQAEYRGLELGGAAAAIEETLLSGADVIFAPSAEIGAYVRARAPDARRIKVTPNGADLRAFVKARSVDIGEDGGPATDAPPPGLRRRLQGRYVVAFVGSLKPWHGVDILIEAYEQLLTSTPRAHLLIVGDGPLSPLVGDAIARLGEHNVTAPGAVDHASVPAWLGLASVGVAPYPRMDGFYFSPIKVAEYMAAGLPVVASDIGQLPELVEDGVSGSLVAPGCPDALATALSSLEAAPKRRDKMGRRARRRAERRHGWDRVAEQIERELLRATAHRQQGAGRAQLAGAAAGGCS